MKLGVSKKLIGVPGIGLTLFLVLAIFSYINLNSFSSIQKRNDELAKKENLITDLQRFIHKILMPPNDYLITGDKKERENFAHLVTEAASTFEKIRLSGGRTSEEIAIADEVEKRFIELQQKAMVLLSTENPVGNKEAAMLMEEMDAFAESVVSKVEKFHDLIKRELDVHNERISKISTWSYRIFISLTFVALVGMVLMILIVTRGVVRPILELEKGAKIIGQGNLEYRIKIETGDEIERLGEEFNNMAQFLKEKINEVKEYSEKLKRTNLQMEQNILHLYTLYNISKTLATTLEMEKLLKQVVENVSQALKLHRINVMLINNDRTEMYIISGIGMNKKAMEIRCKVGEGVYGWTVLTGHAEVINDVSKHSRFKPIQGLDDDIGYLICAPFKGRDQVIGVINAYRLGREEPFDKASFDLLTAVATQVGITLENVRLFEETKTLSITDSMTSLYNYRYFMECLNEEFERAKRYKRPLSLIMIDIDFFKQYNDAHGHPKGDELLRNIAEIFKKTMRKSDTVARYGGEEFTVILPETGKEMAFTMAERLRKEVEANDFECAETQPSGRLTISLGVASYSEESESFEEVIKRADNALYRAKEEGRNRACM
ncbi:MAG: hypothetical protein A2042_02470 [Candidatus Schekmanbacteria bacterium GWA2_38_11]|uniref:Diguanylate cyclase n=1 Tax=Candidatus Schekmanbacteria bacterium GWA2_38_11 TaxID=1817876 RepID=A0A1F7RG14_9BACT|nr:MAG: hypothetical protein A2042_02470 [Candidatus Schekmanbacteria bacterium GWA2_38_11]